MMSVKVQGSEKGEEDVSGTQPWRSSSVTEGGGGGSKRSNREDYDASGASEKKR